MSRPWAINAELRSRDASLLKKCFFLENFLTREASYKPSYLISWSQSELLGTLMPRVGMQNSNPLNVRLR